MSAGRLEERPLTTTNERLDDVARRVAATAAYADRNELTATSILSWPVTERATISRRHTRFAPVFEAACGLRRPAPPGSPSARAPAGSTELVWSMSTDPSLVGGGEIHRAAEELMGDPRMCEDRGHAQPGLPQSHGSVSDEIGGPTVPRAGAVVTGDRVSADRTMSVDEDEVVADDALLADRAMSSALVLAAANALRSVTPDDRYSWMRPGPYQAVGELMRVLRSERGATRPAPEPAGDRIEQRGAGPVTTIAAPTTFRASGGRSWLQGETG